MVSKLVDLNGYFNRILPAPLRNDFVAHVFGSAFKRLTVLSNFGIGYAMHHFNVKVDVLSL